MLRPDETAVPEAELSVEPFPKFVLEAVHSVLERHSSSRDWPYYRQTIRGGPSHYRIFQHLAEKQLKKRP